MALIGIMSTENPLSADLKKRKGLKQSEKW